MNKTAAHIVSSKAENEIYDFIKNDLRVKNILQNDRKLLDNGKELDLYLPDHRIAIEYNGLLWHSEFFGNKNKDYHLEKTDICLSKGIRLIQIFSDE